MTFEINMSKEIEEKIHITSYGNFMYHTNVIHKIHITEESNDQAQKSINKIFLKEKIIKHEF